jgi:small-conductance mechanosensitive channel
MLLAIYDETPAVLDEPAPTVFIDGIVDGRINLNSFAYVAGPRAVYPTRSAILFRLLTDLPAAGIELGSSPQQMQILSGGFSPEAPR